MAMARQMLTVGTAVITVAFAWQLSAAPAAIADCRTLADPAARLACYDGVAGRTNAAEPQAAPISPTPPSVSVTESPPARSNNIPPAQASTPRSDSKPRSDFDSRVTAVIPQRHGYYRFMLEDGSAYLTTAVATPLAVGDAVHVRRTFVGTTYIDAEGRDPISVRLARPQ